MPANLPPEYFEAEKGYRAARSTAEKIARLEELLRTIPKHKGTDKLRAGFRRRLSKLKATDQARKRPSKRESAFRIDREGAGQVVVVGPTNVGKSALVAALTNATPEVADAPHTTWEPTPGMMPMENIQIQLIDTPPLNWDFVEPELLDLIRRSDLILLVVDLRTDPIQQLEDTIALLQEHRIAPRRLRDRYPEPTGLTFIPLLVVVNKNDDEDSDEDFEIFQELLEENWPLLPVSSTTGRNLERLKLEVFERLEIIRVYTKPPGKKPDLTAPFVLKEESTIEGFAGKVHQDFLDNLKTARVWGSAAYDGQMVGRDHVLADGDVVELRT
ncbi:MAG: GTP-binding protein HSR1 [Chloroflexi bacterium B3_Chlor]|nr:MAG: GTP-binding protein HSR1 [Chloroflexi bacterium B3_Chlor]